MKDIFKRLIVVIHYLTFFMGLYYLLNEFPYFDDFYFSLFFFLLGPTLKYIFVGKFLLFPWSEESLFK